MTDILKRRQDAADFQGTCASNSEIADALGIAESDVEDKMLDINLERCGLCDWWHESCELEFDESKGFGCCEQCAPELHGIELD